jgi:hypothetical protein
MFQFFDGLLREPVNQRGTGRHAPRMLKPMPALIGTFLGGAVVGWLLFVGLARLSGNDIAWWSPRLGAIPQAELFDIVRIAATVAALFGGLFAILYAYRKQRVEEASGHRADAEALSKRYQDAAGQLGHAAAAVRLAGAYALARLADEWEEQRQTCVDVLCAYLRMRPKMTIHSEGQYPVEVHEDGDMQVRRTICGLISARVASKGLWSNCDFNLAGAYLIDFKLRDATIGGAFIINNATIEGNCELTRTTFNGGLDARELKIAGKLKLVDVVPGPGKTVSLTESSISEGAILDVVIKTPPRAGDQWQLWPKDIRCAGVFALKLAKTSYEQAALHIDGLNLQPTGVFRVVQMPATEADASYMPRIEANAWSTTKSSNIDMPGAFRKKHVFNAQGWTGVPAAQFKYAYATPPDSDELPIINVGGP